MESIWGSLESLVKINSSLQFAAAVCGVIAALSIILSVFVSNRISTLQDEKDKTARKRLESAEFATKDLERKLILSKTESEKKEIELKNELDDLNKKYGARRIGKEEQAKLISYLSSLPNGQVDIVCVLGDGEGYTFAQDVDMVLKKSSWKTSGVNQAAYTGGNPKGLIIVVNSENPPQHAVYLQKAFEQIGVQAFGHVDKAKPSGSVTLIVGNKL